MRVMMYVLISYNLLMIYAYTIMCGWVYTIQVVSRRSTLLTRVDIIFVLNDFFETLFVYTIITLLI